MSPSSYSRFLSWVLLLLFSLDRSASADCNSTAQCIARVRQIAAESRHFWFGEHRRALCPNAAPSSTAQCWAPTSLAPFHSFGQRLFRVRTFHDAYLQGLQIFPRMTFRSPSDTYRACDHDWVIVNATKFDADPSMRPIEPFYTRNKPEISWHGLRFDDVFTLALVDVGFGTLNWLVEDFPSKTRVLQEYSSSDNFRASANPLALLVFRKGSRELKIPASRDGQFVLADFMLTNGIEDKLIGLGILTVGSDPFAIERQRIKGGVDNCHSLLDNRIHRSSPSRLIAKLPLDEVSAWMTVSYTQPTTHGRLCCQRIYSKEQTFTLDPLGDLELSAMAVQKAPRISMLLPTQPMGAGGGDYRRYTRTFVALTDALYTIALVDGSTGALHWLLIDIPAAILANDARDGGVPRATYLPPAPSRPNSCTSFLIVLLRQTSSLVSTPVFCQGELCHERNMFRIDTFKQRYSLTLTALSWMDVCHDLAFAAHVNANPQVLPNVTRKPVARGVPPRSFVPRRDDGLEDICRIFGHTYKRSCDASISMSLSSPGSTVLPNLTVVSVVLLWARIFL